MNLAILGDRQPLRGIELQAYITARAAVQGNLRQCSVSVLLNERSSLSIRTSCVILPVKQRFVWSLCGQP